MSEKKTPSRHFYQHTWGAVNKFLKKKPAWGSSQHHCDVLWGKVQKKKAFKETLLKRGGRGEEGEYKHYLLFECKAPLVVSILSFQNLNLLGKYA